MSICLRRRDFIAGLGGAAAAWPLAAHAQRPAMPVVGYLTGGRPEAIANQLTAFRKGLSEMGYVEGRNLAIEIRSAHNEYDRLPELAADLVRRRVAVIAMGQHSSGTRGQSRDHDDSNRLRLRRGPGATRPRR